MTEPFPVRTVIVRIGIGDVSLAIVPCIYVRSAITKLYTLIVKEGTFSLIRAIPTRKDILFIEHPITKERCSRCLPTASRPINSGRAARAV